MKLSYGEEPKPIVKEDKEDGKIWVPSERENDKHSVWTAEQIRSLVSLEDREYYETRYQNKIAEFYVRVAELQELVQRMQWGKVLTLKFQKDFCGFYFEHKPVNGVNLYGAPRFYVKIAETEAKELNHHCQYEAYYLRQAIYPQGTTVEGLLPILKFAYNRKFQGY